MRLVMDLWQRLKGQRETANERARDPEVDALHERQHRLISQQTAISGMDQWNAQHRETWRADGNAR